MKYKLIFAILLFIFSCSDNSLLTDSKTLSTADVYLGQIGVISHKPDEKLKQHEKMRGNEYVTDFTIKVHTEEIHFNFYVAVVEAELNKEEKFSSEEAKMIMYKNFGVGYTPNINLNSTADDGYTKGTMNFPFILEHKLAKRDSNDNQLYFSIGGVTEKIDIEGKLQSWSSNGLEAFNILDDDYPIPLFCGKIEQSANKHIVFQIGIVFHDTRETKFDEFVKSQAFINNVFGCFSAIHPIEKEYFDRKLTYPDKKWIDK